MRRRTLVTVATLAGGLSLAAIVALWTPAGNFDKAAAQEAARDFDPRIVRDAFGAPHIYGARNVDVAFGLAYAHAEDDWATMEQVVQFSRGRSAERDGRAGAVTDYLIHAIGVPAALDRRFEADLAPETRALLDAYAAGVNFWCAEAKGRCANGVAPVSGRDIAAGFAARTPFFFGLEETLKELFTEDPERAAAIEAAREAFLRLPPGGELGSNAFAVAPSRSADGATRIAVYSHQPFVGPVAWYEARLKSEEGWDIIGGVFPGSPFVLHGARPELAWAFTVNKPDLVDVYALKVDRPKKPRRYWHDGAWRPFEISTASFRVKLFGPLSLPVSRPVYRTLHGPAFETPAGFVAVAFAGDGDIRAVEQWRRLNFATSREAWLEAMRLQGIPSFNVVYADRSGMIAYHHNAATPIRSENHDWTKPAPGDDAALVWRGVRAFDENPSVVAPASGYVVNANNSPFEASAPEDAPQREDFPESFGVDMRSSNRGLRLSELFGADGAINADEFVSYKMDDAYTDQSRLVAFVDALLADREAGSDPSLAPALAVLRGWDRTAARDSRGAALAILAGRKALGVLLNGEGAPEPDPRKALASAADEILAGFGRLDPAWGEVNRLRRGAVDLPLDGGPDTWRAIYPDGDPSAGPMTAVGGDSYIMIVDWAPDGGQSIRTIHQFGSATLDPTSPHYADQAPLFAEKRFRRPPMSLAALEAEKTADERPTRRP